MRETGIFSLAVVTAVIAITVFALSAQVNSGKISSETASAMIELEALSLERTIIENNADFLAGKAVEETVLVTENPEAIRIAVEEKLSAYFSRIEAEGIAEIKTAKEFSRDYSGIFAGNKGKFLGMGNSFRAIVAGISPKAFAVEIEFVGNNEKDSVVLAEIKKGNSGAEFFLPIGYRKRMVFAR